MYNSIEQECIPVGCVPSAAVAVSGGGSPHPPGTGSPPWEQAPLPPGAGTPPRAVPPPWTETLTHATENITLPQTSFAGGNNYV